MQSKRAIALLCAAPALVALAVLLAPIVIDPVALFGGLPYDLRPNWQPGFTTIDPNQGYTSYALGVRAALDLVGGRVPLWNPFEGLGSPLLGEMQSAALFPPTLLLLLPHGQVIEQAFLQIVAGIGTFMFLRRFGLGVTAALAGGLLFEFNGVFAWLRNAIYNPVALLPWLFYAVEALFAACLAGQPWRRRGGIIALGAIAAALALYAGFPEVVFYYCLPLFGWVAIRAAALPWRRALAYLGDLALLGVAALALAAPLLLAFGHFLADGNVGDHTNNGFKDAVLPSGAMAIYLLPYLFGPISSSVIPAAARFWGNGGYLGLTAFVLAIGGVLTGWRRPVVWLLAAWIVFAVGVSHDAPVLLDVFRYLPLVTVSIYSRYLNAGWLFCAITLAAMFIDRLPALSPATRRRLGLAAAGLGALGLAGALALVWPVLEIAWRPHQDQRVYVVASAAAALMLLSGIVVAVCRRRPSGVLTALAAIEAIALFAFPFASAPRAGKIDMQLVTFLQRHAGLQRVATASGNGLTPNFGSAFGISTINYDDLPVPNRTVRFVQRELDPKALPIMFRPNILFRNETPAERRDDFLARTPAYERAGVRYVLADAAFFAVNLALKEGGTRPVPLFANQSVTLSRRLPPGIAEIDAISVRIGTYGGKSDGTLLVRLCQAAECQERSVDLATAPDNSTLSLALTPAFAVTDAPFQITLSKQGGDEAVALWSAPPSPGETAVASGLPAMQGVLPRVGFEGANSPALVLQTPTTSVFELPGAHAYASAPGCRIEAQSHEHMQADCERPARLTRLEVFMAGWTASVNGVPTAVTPFDDTFQTIDLPAGRSVIDFAYAPTGVRPALWIAAITLLGLMLLARNSTSGRNRT